MGAVFSFAIFGAIILLGVLSFVHLQESASQAQARHAAQASAQEVAQAVVAVGLLVEDQGAPPTGAVSVQVDLPERIAGRQFSVQLEAGGTVLVRIPGLGVEARAPLMGMEQAGAPPAWSLCSSEASGGRLEVAFDPGVAPPATGCPAGSLYLVEASP